MATETFHSTTQVTTQQYSIWKYTIGGVIAGLIAGIGNNLWILVYPFIAGSDAPPGVDAMSVSVFSFIPMVLAGFIYYALSMKNAAKGTRIFVTMGLLIFLASLYGPLNPEQMGALFTSGEVPEGFALFTIPMHIIAAVAAVGFLPKFVMSE